MELQLIQSNIDFFNIVTNVDIEIDGTDFKGHSEPIEGMITISSGEVEGIVDGDALTDKIIGDKVHITNFVGSDVPIDTGLTLTPSESHQLDLEDQIKQEELIRLKSECKEKGIKFHHKAGIKKLKALLNK